MKKALIANIFGIGDVLFTVPVIVNLRREFPGISVGYLCNARTADIVKCMPGVDEVFIYEKDRFVSLWRGSKVTCIKSLGDLFQEIRSKNYEAVFDLTLSREFGFFFKLMGIPLRVGFDYKRRGIFLTRKFPLSGFKGKHVIEYNLDLLEATGISPEERVMHVVLDPETEKWADDYVARKGLKGRSFTAVVPGGGASWGKHASRKRWHAEGFARVAETLEERGIRTVILGDGSEKPLCDYVVSEMGISPAAVENSLSLKEYMGILSRAEAVLCNDGGPLHIAVALGIKTLSIFGPVDDKVYGPYPRSERHKVIKVSGLPCRPCYDRFKLPECGNEHRCITDIGAEKVAEACLELLRI
ncbi:MAG: glycosyltransferase family 9 protein [Candidatus Omnitrophota bacterium]